MEKDFNELFNEQMCNDVNINNLDFLLLNTEEYNLFRTDMFVSNNNDFNSTNKEMFLKLWKYYIKTGNNFYSEYSYMIESFLFFVNMFKDNSDYFDKNSYLYIGKLNRDSNTYKTQFLKCLKYAEFFGNYDIHNYVSNNFDKLIDKIETELKHIARNKHNNTILKDETAVNNFFNFLDIDFSDYRSTLDFILSKSDNNDIIDINKVIDGSYKLSNDSDTSIIYFYKDNIISDIISSTNVLSAIGSRYKKYGYDKVRIFNINNPLYSSALIVDICLNLGFYDILNYKLSNYSIVSAANIKYCRYKVARKMFSIKYSLSKNYFKNLDINKFVITHNQDGEPIVDKTIINEIIQNELFNQNLINKKEI